MEEGGGREMKIGSIMVIPQSSPGNGIFGGRVRARTTCGVLKKRELSAWRTGAHDWDATRPTQETASRERRKRKEGGEENPADFIVWVGLGRKGANAGK